MNAQSVEAHVLEAIDRAKRGLKNEDARIELKREWPVDHAKAARRIAGHCNAARSPWVLWIIGLGEGGEQGAIENHDAKSWFEAVRRFFNGISPECTDYRVIAGDMRVVALLFDSSRLPYVVRNAAYGDGGDKVELEVPWRELTTVRSARRDELIRMLMPLTPIPEIELVYGQVAFGRNSDEPVRWNGDVRLFISPTATGTTVIPMYKCKCVLRWTTSRGRRRIRLSTQPSVFDPTDSSLIKATYETIVCRGPGIVYLTFQELLRPNEPLDDPDGTLSVSITFGLLGAQRCPTLSFELHPLPHSTDGKFKRWESSPYEYPEVLPDD